MRRRRKVLTACLLIGGIGMLLFAAWAHRFIIREGYAGHTGRHGFAGVASYGCVSLMYAYAGNAPQWEEIDINERSEDKNELSTRIRLWTSPLGGSSVYHYGAYNWRFPLSHVTPYKINWFSCHSWGNHLSGAKIYLLQIPSWFFAALGLAMLLWSWRRWHAARHRLNVFCDTCGYDLRGSAESERCPECGTEIAPSMRERIAGALRGR